MLICFVTPRIKGGPLIKAAFTLISMALAVTCSGVKDRQRRVNSQFHLLQNVADRPNFYAVANLANGTADTCSPNLAEALLPSSERECR